MLSMWPSWNQWWFELGQFFQTGGWVLYGILLVCLVMASLIAERLAFRFWVYRSLKDRVKRYSETGGRLATKAVCPFAIWIWL